MLCFFLARATSLSFLHRPTGGLADGMSHEWELVAMMIA